MPLLESVGYDYRNHDDAIQKIINQLPLPIPTIIIELRNLYTSLYNIEEHEINQGMCEAFAQDLQFILKDGEVFWADEMEDGSWEEHGAHAFLKIGDTFYDSQCPEGTTNWKYLPFFFNA